MTKTKNTTTFTLTTNFKTYDEFKESLKNTYIQNDSFLDNFWKSRSLNDLNATINKIPPSPMKEVFCTGYNEILIFTLLNQYKRSRMVT